MEIAFLIVAIAFAIGVWCEDKESPWN